MKATRFTDCLGAVLLVVWLSSSGSAALVYFQGFEPGNSSFDDVNMYPTTAEDPRYGPAGRNWIQPPVDVGEWESGWFGNWNDGQGADGPGAPAANGNTGFISATGGMHPSRDSIEDLLFNTNRDITGDFGNAFEISFWVKDFGTQADDGLILQLRGSDASGGDRYNYTVFGTGQTPTEWTKVTVPINVAWNTDSLAADNGWIRNAGANAGGGITTAVTNLFQMTLFPQGGERIGIDEVRVAEAIPEPATIVLAGLACVVMLCRKRSQAN